MGLLDQLFANIENTRGQIKRRGLLDTFGSEVAKRMEPGLIASERMASVVPEVKESGRKAMTEQGLGLLGAIKAFHGSPHKFDKFDMSKIGTGEGAQAYGHGLYFAENPKTAEQYRKNLAVFPEIRKGMFDAAGNPDRARQAAGWIDSGAVEAGDTKQLREFLKPLDPKASQHQVDEWIAQGRSIYAKAQDAGGMYEVSLRWPDAAREARDPLGPQHFLDWDKPLAEQPEGVRAVISREIDRSGGSDGYKGEKFLAAPTKSGGTDYKAVGSQIYSGLSSDGQAQLSKRLRDAGIPGIRYLDAGSRGNSYKVSLSTARGPYTENRFATQHDAEQYAAAKAAEGFKTDIAQEGTANYVAFDDALIEILKRNGMAP